MNPLTYLCVVCGKEFEPYRNHQKYCSKPCRDRADKNDRRFGGIREYIFDRDSNLCVACGSEGGLVVHHKDFDRTNNVPDNLETLCRSCHAKIHHLHTWTVKPETRKCIVCDGEYHPIQDNQKLCRRRACRAERKKLQKRSSHESVECVVCGKVFVQKHSSHLCCSPECSRTYANKQKRDNYCANREQRLEKQKRYYVNNREKVKAYVTKWRKANPDKVAKYYGKS